MSATQSRSRLSTTKLRCTRSGAGRAFASRTVVESHLRRLTPCKPASFISRAAAFHQRSHPLATAPTATHRQLKMHPRDSVGLPRILVDGTDLGCQLFILLRPF